MKNQSKFKEAIRTIKFTLISISAGIIQIGTFTILNLIFKNADSEATYSWPYLISLWLSVLWNFTINRKITFKAANNVKVAMLLVLLFYVIFTPVSTYLGELAKSNGINEFIVLVITMIANFVLEYLYTRYIVYRNSCDTATKKEK